MLIRQTLASCHKNFDREKRSFCVIKIAFIWRNIKREISIHCSVFHTSNFWWIFFIYVTHYVYPSVSEQYEMSLLKSITTIGQHFQSMFSSICYVLLTIITWSILSSFTPFRQARRDIQMNVCVYEKEREREREIAIVIVSEWGSEREREREKDIEWERKRERERERERYRVREKERERKRERERERERKI